MRSSFLLCDKHLGRIARLRAGARCETSSIAGCKSLAQLHARHPDWHVHNRLTGVDMSPTESPPGGTDVVQGTVRRRSAAGSRTVAEDGRLQEAIAQVPSCRDQAF